MSKGTHSHYSAFIVVKVLLQLHFVLMMKSCFVSTHLIKQTVLLYNSQTIKLQKRSHCCTTASSSFFQVVVAILNFQMLYY